MRTKALRQTVIFKDSPRQVYDLLMDSKKHQSLSDEPAKISNKVGGKFTAWRSHLSGIHLVVKPGRKIVQAWRATGWWPDHYSIAIFDIKKLRQGARLEFTQIGISPNRFAEFAIRQAGSLLTRIVPPVDNLTKLRRTISTDRASLFRSLPGASAHDLSVSGQS